MKGLKASLLTAKPQIIEVEILCGVKVNIRRMTANELMQLETDVSDLNRQEISRIVTKKCQYVAQLPR